MGDEVFGTDNYHEKNVIPTPMTKYNNRKVQVGKDQEKAQSEKELIMYCP